MQGRNPILQGGRELVYVKQQDTYTGSLFQRVINAINQVAASASISPLGKLQAPPPIQEINVSGDFSQGSNTITCPGEFLHWTITHNSAIQKGIQYITEIDNNPSFTSPHPIDHGCSRSGFMHLPANDSSGNPATYYMRSFAQYHGSDPSPKKVLGGTFGATAIQMTGTSKGSLLPSQGSGTAANGQQGGKGLGTVLYRQGPEAKRQLT